MCVCKLQRGDCALHFNEPPHIGLQSEIQNFLHHKTHFVELTKSRRALSIRRQKYMFLLPSLQANTTVPCARKHVKKTVALAAAATGCKLEEEAASAAAAEERPPEIIQTSLQWRETNRVEYIATDAASTRVGTQSAMPVDGAGALDNPSGTDQFQPIVREEGVNCEICHF